MVDADPRRLRNVHRMSIDSRHPNHRTTTAPNSLNHAAGRSSLRDPWGWGSPKPPGRADDPYRRRDAVGQRVSFASKNEPQRRIARRGTPRQSAMASVWLASSLWIGLALVASVLSIWVAISVALVEIVVGAVAGNLIGLPLAPWVNFLAGFGAILLTFLAGAEIDPDVVRRKFWPSMSIGVVGFAAPYVGVLLFARYVVGWPWPEAQIAGISLSTTSVAVVYAVMVETGFNQTELGKIILAACFVNDLGTVLALGLVFAHYDLWLALFVAVTLIALWLLWKFAPRVLQLLGD